MLGSVVSRLNCVAKRLLLAALFFLAGISLSFISGHAFKGFGLYKEGKKFESFGTRKSKEEIEKLIREKKARPSAQPGADAEGLKAGPEGKYALEKGFAYGVHSLEKVLKKAERKKARGLDLSIEAEEVLSRIKEIKAADEALRQKFADTEGRLIDAGFSDLILERHRRMVENYDKNMTILLRNMGEVEDMIGKKAWGKLKAVLGKIEKHLKENPVLKDPPLHSNGLPHSLKILEAPSVQKEERVIPSVDPIKIIPGAEKEEAERAKEPLRPSVEKEEGPQAKSFLTGPPALEDLNPTIDVQITQEIIDLAASLDESPVAILRFVQDSFDFEPYLGSRKGSQESLKQKSGNDYDLASLLIALLRASGIPARYVRGMVEMTPEKAMNWLGVEDPATAGSILTTAGMEGVNILDGEEVVAIRFRHVWVEAYMPYTNYRGIPVDQTGKMWIPIDPSFKKYGYQAGIDVLSEMGFDAEAFINNYITTFHEPSPVELMIQQIQGYLAVNYPGLSYEDIARTRSILAETLEFVPGSLPFKVLSVDSDFAEIPADKRHQIRFHLYNGGTTLIDYTANLPEIAGKRVTISYVAATPEDQAVIDSYGDLYETPPYLVNLKPVLKVDGTDVAVGGSGVGMGRTHGSDMHFITPVGDTNEMPLVSNEIISGTYQAIGINTKRIAPDIFMPDPGGGTPTTDEWTGGKLWRTAMGYLDRLVWADEEVAKTMQMVVLNDVTEAIVENTILVTFSFGTPQTFEWRGLAVDADRNIVGPFAVNGDQSKNKPFMVLTGADGSTSENRIFEDTYDEEAVSTIKILELASDMGIPIYRFDSGNIGAIYSSLNLSSSVENAIYTAVAGGHEVTVPRDNITYLEWTGTGYIDMDPVTGAAGYIISGGQSGGATVDEWSSPWMNAFATSSDLCDTNPITAVINYPPNNSYFPHLNWFDFISSNTLRFDVTYNVCLKTVGTVSLHEGYGPHYPYPPGDYTFYAGYGTGETVNFTIFGVEIETPDGEEVINGCESITLEAKLTPRTPPLVSYKWGASWTLGCILGCGDGTFTPDNAANTEFVGTDGGKLTAKVEVSNTYGTTSSQKALKVVEVAIGSIDSNFAPSVENLDIEYNITPENASAKFAKIEIFQNGDITNPIFSDESISKTGTNILYSWNGKANQGGSRGKFISPTDSPFTAKISISTKSDFNVSDSDTKTTKVEIESITLNPSGALYLLKPYRSATETDREIEALVMIKNKSAFGVTAEIPIKVYWSFEDPDDTATKIGIDSNGNAGDDNAPIANSGKRGTGSTMWKAVLGFTTNLDANGQVADCETKTTGTDKGKSRIKFSASAIGGDNYILVSQCKDFAGNILMEQNSGTWSIRKTVTFPRVYNMDGGVDAGAVMTEANINPAFNGDGYTDYTRGNVTNLAPGGNSPEYVVPLLAPNAAETPTGQELADYGGSDPGKKAAALAAITAKAQAWYERNENNQGASFSAYQTTIGATAPCIIGARYFGAKFDGRAASGQTNYYPAGISISVYMGTADPDDDWYEPQGAEFGGVVYIFLNSGNAARRQIVGRHEVGHASDHVSFGTGDHAPVGSGCLMAPAGESNLFCDTSILRLRGYSP